ncbi:MAG: hypothetical protein KGL53_12620, partial [Elusimicrobia bacterium]|nr:hypothetical protein [Elusimicrobiota bacterium]
FLALPAAAQFRAAPVELSRPALPVPALLAAPALTPLSAASLPSLAVSPLPSALPSALPTAMPVVRAAAAVPAAPERAAASPLRSLTQAEKGFGRAARGSGSELSARAAAFFDGAGALPAVSAVREAAPADGFSWKDFESADGARVSYALRRPETEKGPARVFVGGMTLPESFQTYFRTERPERAEYALSFRGLPPTAWHATRELFDADARDLARMINVAAARSPGGRVELALHSYGTLAFQRMVQLRAEPEVAKALAALRGQRVVMFSPTTHYGDSETVAGPQYAQMARQVRMLVDWLDAGDLAVSEWRAAARLNPLLYPQAEAVAMAWAMQRDTALAMAAQPASQLQLDHLSEKWSPELEGTRKELVRRTRRASSEAGWQEAALRRANDTSKLDFTAADAEAVRKAGVRLDLVLSHDDQLIPWASARLLPALFGVELPEAAPAAGTLARDASGAVRVMVLDGDHYLPLKHPRRAADVLGR